MIEELDFDGIFVDNVEMDNDEFLVKIAQFYKQNIAPNPKLKDREYLFV